MAQVTFHFFRISPHPANEESFPLITIQQHVWLPQAPVFAAWPGAPKWCNYVSNWLYGCSGRTTCAALHQLVPLTRNPTRSARRALERLTR